ncbi:hypothetical protein L798_04453 [Zootermopsis nevadensis]|uniref:Uncharacterized protein n=1 Tax=Zootermopsis nevadensis TaxID=136037 RepID=A0A067RJI0_ZOONE|nr:hypothetical protein L798_04453 [Zootermopsis nevadensis]
MERQSELDAADLESADESREKVIRDTSDEDDDEDVYEPFESYNYESRHVRYPGNRLQNEEYPYPDEDWNSKRGYFIYHEADNPSQNYNHKETKRRDNKSESYVAEPQDTDVDGGGPSKLNRTSEDSAKIVTKSGVKGFYIQRSSDTATESSNPDRRKESVKEKSGAKVLTYVVDQKTGEGSWIPGVDDTKDVERDEGETLEIEEPKRANVRGSSKSRNSLRKQNGKERKALVNKEGYQEENPEDVLVTDMGNKESGGDDRDRKVKTNRGKSRKEKRPSNHDTEEYAVEVNPDEIRDDSSLNPTNKKKLSQNRLRKHSGKYRQKDKTRGEQLPEDTSGDDEERSKNSRRNFRKKDRENLEFESDDDDDDEEASDTYKFDRAPKSRKSAHRRNRPGQYKSDVNQFKDTDRKIKSSASEIIYYEEAFPEATTHNEERKDGYKEETGDGEGDGEEYHEEGIASAPPERKGYSDDEGGDGRVQDFVKHPGDRFYYYVDEPEEI